MILKRMIALLTLAVFLAVQTVPGWAQQGAAGLPVPGTLVALSAPAAPPLLRGMKVDPAKPFQFDFILDTGDTLPRGAQMDAQAAKLIRYFLAALAMPAEDLWVNLSPYEQDRIVPDTFGLTEMGRDMLAQDYLLKQVASSLTFPEGDTGRRFWDAVYRQTREQLGGEYFPDNAFHKIWIVPAKASVYEDGAGVYVTDARLKLMLETDYFAQRQQRSGRPGAVSPGAVAAEDSREEIVKKTLREVILPVLEKEINEGSNFAPVRQIYFALILAKWYKDTLKDSIINRGYSDRRQVHGVDLADRAERTQIYDRYVEAFRKGAFNYIKEEYDAASKEVFPRKYFSGGLDFSEAELTRLPRASVTLPELRSALWLRGNLVAPTGDNADDTTKGERRNRTPEREALASSIASIEGAVDFMDKMTSAMRSGWIKRDDLETVINRLEASDPLGRLASEVNAGGRVVIISRPGTTAFGNGIQDFNNNPTLGPKLYDWIVEFSRAKWVEQMRERGLVISPRPVILSNYKIIVFSVRGDIADIDTQLASAREEVSRQVIQALTTDPRFQERVAAAIQDKKLQLQGKTEDGSPVFSFDFGVSAPVTDGQDLLVKGTEKGVAAKLMALVQANVALQARKMSVDRLVGDGVFRVSDMETVISEYTRVWGEIQELYRQGVVNKGLLVELPGEGLQVPMETFQAMRSPDFRSSLPPEQADLFYRYRQLLPVVDFIKHWQLELDIAMGRSQRVAETVKKLKQGLPALAEDRVVFWQMSKAAQKTVATQRLPVGTELRQALGETIGFLSEDPKYPGLTNSSLAVMARGAEVLQGGGLVLTADVKGMGPQNMVSFSRLMARLSGGENMAALLWAGDDVTMRFRSSIQDALDFFHGRGIFPGLVRSGGDEVDFYLSSEDAAKWTLADALRLAELTGWRLGMAKGFDIALKHYDDRVALVGAKGPVIDMRGDAWLAFATLLHIGDSIINAIKEIEKNQGRSPVVVGEFTAKDGVVLKEVRVEGGLPVEVLLDGAQEGGINFNPDEFTLDRNGQPVTFDIPAAAPDITGGLINGLVPVIRSITPVKDLPAFFKADKPAVSATIKA